MEDAQTSLVQAVPPDPLIGVTDQAGAVDTRLRKAMLGREHQSHCLSLVHGVWGVRPGHWFATSSIGVATAIIPSDASASEDM